MLRNTRILIVDEHLTNVAILEEILGEHYTLKTATCGEEALAIALDFNPALILLDIMMRGIGGYETCRRIRAHHCAAAGHGVCGQCRTPGTSGGAGHYGWGRWRVARQN